ncbi:hypothetical protein STEG23_014393, partial [Scotinomys teguina]
MNPPYPHPDGFSWSRASSLWTQKKSINNDIRDSASPFLGAGERSVLYPYFEGRFDDWSCGSHIDTKRQEGTIHPAQTDKRLIPRYKFVRRMLSEQHAMTLSSCLADGTSDWSEERNGSGVIHCAMRRNKKAFSSLTL